MATKTTCCLQQINHHQADLTVYTDGSASSRTADGGFAIVVTQGQAEQPTVIGTVRERGRNFTSSFKEEHAATITAIQWLATDNLPDPTALLCTDSKLLCDTLLGRNSKVNNIKLLIRSIAAKIIIQWIPGHSNIPVTS